MKDKDEFIRAVTHDLNAPVRNIAGMTKMLIMKYREQLNEDALSKLERIAANARAESELLADLLELSRIRSQPGKTQRVKLTELVASIGEALAYDLESRGITLAISPDLPTLTADRNRVRQVFQNLVDNAVKYMPDDAPIKQVTVGCERDGEQTLLFVRDTGRGIADKDHERIFQVFQRARYSGDHATPGRGVGLASVKTIIETLGGRIWVDSEPGQGATFYFTFARRVFSETPEEKPAVMNDQ
jgi:signal transduction histidine kinase